MKLQIPKTMSRIKYLFLCAALLSSLVVVSGVGTARAADALPDCTPSTPLLDNKGNPVQCNPKPVTQVPTDPAAAAAACKGQNCGLIEKYVNPTINFLAIIVGLVAVIAIVVGGIQYSASADEPQALSAAKKRIANAVLGLVAFLFLYAFLQWVLPGGFL